MNLIAGFIVIVALYSMATSLPTTTIDRFEDGFAYEGELALMEGDTIFRIDGMRVYQTSNILFFLDTRAEETVDIEVIRDGERVLIERLPLQREIFVEGGPYVYGLWFDLIENPTIGERLGHSVNVTRDFMRQIVLTVRMFAAGQAGVDDVSSVVGIVDVMNQAGQTAETARVAVERFLFISGLIAVNLALMNLLPIPGLDGGRIFLMLITAGIERVTKRKLDPKYEGYLNTVGIVLLFGFMIFIIFQDVIRIIWR